MDLENDVNYRRDKFKEVFGYKLIHEGFFWKRNAFYRIGDNVVLMIGARFVYRDCSTRWRSIPFCAYEEIDKNKFSVSSCLQIEGYIFKNTSVTATDYNNMNTTQLLDLTYDYFFKDIFPLFNTVSDTQSNLEYMKKFYGTDSEPRPLSITKAWHCIYLKRYDEAIRYIGSYIDTMDLSYPNEVKQEEIDCLKRYDKYQNIIEDFRNANTLKAENYKSQLEGLLQLLESRDYCVLDAILKQRIDNAHLVCREFFGVRRFPL